MDEAVAEKVVKMEEKQLYVPPRLRSKAGEMRVVKSATSTESGRVHDEHAALRRTVRQRLEKEFTTRPGKARPEHDSLTSQLSEKMEVMKI